MMKTKRLMWDQVDKTQIPLDRLVEEYLLVCRTEGKSPKALLGYREKLGRFCSWLDGNLGEFTLQAARTCIGELQRTGSIKNITITRFKRKAYPALP